MRALLGAAGPLDERVKQEQERSSARVSDLAGAGHCSRRLLACSSGLTTASPELGALPPVRGQERFEAALHLHIPLQIISARLLEKLQVSRRAMRWASCGTVGRRRPRVCSFGAVRSC